VQRNKIIDLLHDEEAVDFLVAHWHEVPENVALRYADKVSFDLKTLCQLLHLYHKAENKLPSWVHNRCALSPKAYEQSTSEKVAKFKSELFSGELLLDLTAGLGVDSVYFSQSFNQVIAIEKDATLCEIAVYNAQKLGLENLQFANDDGINFSKYLSGKPTLIYLDPDRRPDGNSKVVKLSEYLPNIIEIRERLFEYCDQILIKISPMVDLTYLRITLPESSDIWVISENNEVKEVLVLLSKTPKPLIVHAVDIHNTGTYLYAQNDLHHAVSPWGSERIAYIFEPYKALIKAGLVSQYASEFGLKFLHPQTNYFVTTSPGLATFGRTFRVIEKWSVNWKQIKKQLNSLEIKSLSISKRNFPESIKSIRKRLAVADGGDYTLLFATGEKEEKVCFLTERIIESSTD